MSSGGLSRIVSWLLFVALQTKSRLGSVRSPAVGQLFPDLESHSGGCCHAFPMGHADCIPATMPGFGGGEPGTWRSPHGGLRRVGCVGVGQELLGFVVSARVLCDLSVAVNLEPEHFVSMVHLEFSSHKPVAAKFKPWF